MRNLDERWALVKETLEDPERGLNYVEQVQYVYKWWRFELALAKRRKAVKAMKKWGNELQKDQDVFNFRKSMKDV